MKWLGATAKVSAYVIIALLILIILVGLAGLGMVALSMMQGGGG